MPNQSPFSLDFKSFQSLYNKGKAQVITTQIIADLETPVSAYLQLVKDAPNSFLLESVEGGAVIGRYSFIGMSPDIIWQCEGGTSKINRNALNSSSENDFTPCDLPPLDELRNLIKETRMDIPDNLPPMSAGLFGYLGYDTIRLMEKIPDRHLDGDNLNLPDAIMIRPTLIAVFDNIDRIVTLVTPVRPKEEISAKKAYKLASTTLNNALTRFNTPLDRPVTTPNTPQNTPNVTSNTPENTYFEMVNKAKEYIKAGDIFQTVLSQRFSTKFTKKPFNFYRSLRRLNPSPFLFYLNFQSFNIIGSSPEILVRLRQNKVTIRPLAGTRKRGKTPEEDRQNAADLLNDSKELAEHLMLLDLGRNDIGRVAKIGSIRVTEQFKIEYYSHVMHIVSNVEAQLDPQKSDIIDALKAGFPAGTVSGAPKIRAMEIIDELEQSRRGIYGGCVGYFGANGDMDTAISLRTAVLKDETLYIQAGAGIVADSIPKNEYDECKNKAMALLKAAEQAE